MLRRALIPLAILLAFPIGAAWLLSSLATVTIQWQQPGIRIVLRNGGLYFHKTSRAPGSGYIDLERVEPRRDPAPFYYLGFNASAAYGPPFVRIPFWFLTTLHLLLLWFIWRKTRPKLVSRAFPVEATSDH